MQHTRLVKPIEDQAVERHKYPGAGPKASPVGSRVPAVRPTPKEMFMFIVPSISVVAAFRGRQAWRNVAEGVGR